MESLSTTCVIAGGGPAGMMLGLLLARAGVDVTVLEKHKDFLRDFRGDTVHPSTLLILQELGCLEEFLALPHARIRYMAVEFGEARYRLADFGHLPGPCPFIVLMPQWDFLDFLARKAKAYPNFHLLMETEAKDLLAKGDRIAGVLAKGPNGNLQIRAGLTVACDGRHSTLRTQSGLKLKEMGVPFDVLWFALPHYDSDPVDLIGRIADGAFLVMAYRGTYWQCAYGIAKGSFERLRAEGLGAFRQRLKVIAGFAEARVEETIQGFDQVKLLTVRVNRLTRWARPGLLCIGDAAHAMSPAGGVGINLAIQDAVAAANILSPILRRGIPKLADLEKVQKRRDFPTRVTQAIQLRIQQTMLAPTLRQTGQAIRPPLFVRLFHRIPLLQRLPARILGWGIRPEHVDPR